MSIRTSRNLTSSLTTAPFKRVQQLDRRGLALGARSDITTQRQLFQSPVPSPNARGPQGRVRSFHDIATST